MSNEFDKEVAAKIAEKLKRPELDCIPTDDGNFVYYKNFQDLIVEDGDTMTLKTEYNDTVRWDEPPRTEEVYEPKEMSKIDFYRQKVQQYEAVENLIQSIECELEDVLTAKLELDDLKEDAFGRGTHLLNTYKDMELVYQSCITCLKDLLNRM